MKSYQKKAMSVYLKYFINIRLKINEVEADLGNNNIIKLKILME